MENPKEESFEITSFSIRVWMKSGKIIKQRGDSFRDIAIAASNHNRKKESEEATGRGRWRSERTTVVTVRIVLRKGKTRVVSSRERDLP